MTMNMEAIVGLIMAVSPIFGIEPKVAVSVAMIESAMNPHAIGSSGEIGLFQIMPNIAKAKGYSKKQLLDPTINIFVGLQMLKEAKEGCVHKHKNDWLVCYNYGAKNARNVKHPRQFPYVKKINAELSRKKSSPKAQIICRR